MLERFGGYTLTTLLEEDAGILRLLELESYGDRGEEQERLEEMQAELDNRIDSIEAGEVSYG